MNNETITNLGEVKPKILIGGKEGKFVPNLNISFHDDEFFINLNRRDKIITDETAEIQNYKTVLGGADGDIFHVDEDGNFKWDIEFKEKPKSNIFKWELKSKGVEFFYQGELTPEEIADGCERPESVVGSYAVYCNKANNKYKTGKVCHIYRPLCIDATGKKVYAELLIENGYLIITIPQDYMDNAVYPMTLDPTIGYTSIGASSWGHVDRIVVNRYACSADGSSPATFYARVATKVSDNLRGCVYANNGGTANGQAKLSSDEAEITAGTAPLWVSGAITVSGGFASGTDYFIGAHIDYCNIAYDTGTEGYNDAEYFSAQTYTPGSNSLPSTFTSSGGLARQLSFYIDYSEASTYSGILKRYNGSAWVKEPLKYYNGTAFATKPLKRWNGSAWVTVDTTGV